MAGKTAATKANPAERESQGQRLSEKIRTLPAQKIAEIVDNYGAENMGFAVPASTLRDILPQRRDKGAARLAEDAEDDLLAREAQAVSADAFRRVWDNRADSRYDRR